MDWGQRGVKLGGQGSLEGELDGSAAPGERRLICMSPPEPSQGVPPASRAAARAIRPGGSDSWPRARRPLPKAAKRQPTLEASTTRARARAARGRGGTHAASVVAVLDPVLAAQAHVRRQRQLWRLDDRKEDDRRRDGRQQHEQQQPAGRHGRRRGGRRAGAGRGEVGSAGRPSRERRGPPECWRRRLRKGGCSGWLAASGCEMGGGRGGCRGRGRGKTLL